MSTDVIPSDPKQVAKSFISTYFPENSNMADFLSYCIVGFNQQEACQLANISYPTVCRWKREDQQFALMMERMADLRRQLSNEFVNRDFTRNFMLLLKKDASTIKKSIETPELMEDDDIAYLNKIRGMYTPESLAKLQGMVDGRTTETAQFNWTEQVLRRRTRDTDGYEVEEVVEQRRG